MIGNALGVLAFSFLTVFRLKEAMAGAWQALFLALQSGAALLLYFRRMDAEEEVAWQWQLFAWASAFLPLMMQPRSVLLWQQFLPLPGLLLAVWSMFALDRSFSIAPAKRSLVRSGPYAYLRHPMYLGEVLSLLAVVLTSFSVRNLLIFSLFLLSLFWRMKQEEMLLYPQ